MAIRYQSWKLGLKSRCTAVVKLSLIETSILQHVQAKLQNTEPFTWIYILLNHNNDYCVMFPSSKGFDKYKTGGPKWPCIL